MEKKNYSSPTLLVEQFTTNHSVAEGCNSQVIYQDYVYIPCTIHCIISSEDVIFTSKTGHGVDPDTGLDWGSATCAHQVEPNQSGSGYYFANYGGTQYFVWHSQAEGGGGGSFATLRAILSAAGLTYGVDYNTNGSRLINGRNAGDVWHAGPTSDCKEQMSQLLGFSF